MFKYFKKHVSRYAEDMAEVLAPTYRTPQEEFKYNWTTMSELLTNKATGVADADDDRDAVDDDFDEAKVFRMLDRMLEMLINEDQEHEAMGPCMEFMLQSGVLKQLVHLGQFDWPKDIMGKVLDFFSELLANIKQTPMIPDKHVYGPLKNLMLVHVESEGLINSNPEAAVGFLTTLCDKLGQNPVYAHFFIQSKKEAVDVFLPMKMLHPLLGHPDGDIVVQACGCLKVALEMNSPAVDAIFIEGGLEAVFITQRFVEMFAALPPQYDVEELQLHVIEWTDTRFDGWKKFDSTKHTQVPEDVRSFFMFMDWVHYFDDLLEQCGDLLAEHLVNVVINKFFVEQLVPMLTQQAEEVAYATTSYLSACVNQISSTRFLHGLVEFLLGSTSKSTLENSEMGSTDAAKTATSDRISALLVQRCDDISDELSAATLHLFLRLLLKRDPLVIETLVLKYAASASPPPITELRVVMRSIADQFTAEVPTNLQSTEDIDLSYKEYFIDAQQAVLACRRAVQLARRADKSHDACKENIDDDDGPNFDDDDDEEDVPGTGSDDPASNNYDAPVPVTIETAMTAVSNSCDSPFLKVLGRKLLQLENQPYSLNLLITANFAALFEYPDPVLQAILLTSGEHTVFAAFSQLCRSLKSKSARIDNIETRLLEERSKLETQGAAETLHQMSKSLQAMIVLEEFAKEVAARLLVQCNEMLLDT